MNLNDLLGDSLSSLGMKQAPKQTLGGMKTTAPPARPVAAVPQSPLQPMFGTPGPAPGGNRSEFDLFAPMASPQVGMRPPAGAAAAAPAGSAGGLDDLFGNVSLGARQNNSGGSLAGCATRPLSEAACDSPVRLVSGLDSARVLAYRHD